MNPAVFFRSRSQSRHKTFTMRGQPSTPRNRTAQFAVSPTAAALAFAFAFAFALVTKWFQQWWGLIK